ncbi:MAG: META domain-containing protein [Candidatus Limnocylindrales bacterium]
MNRTVLARTALAVATALSMPAAAVAQEETTPEGRTWQLTAYADDATASVPFYIQATLLLEDGTASGSTGCNSFSGTYAIDGSELSFGETFATTRAACPEETTAAVEDGYLAALPRAAAWEIEGDQLRLTAADEALMLTFEEPVVSLTRSALAEITGLLSDQQAEISRADERIDDIRVGTLRDRIKELEAAVVTLQAQAAASSGSGSGARFDAAETVLLKAIPQRVERTCRPLRSGLPRGTVAAVACDGSRRTVAEQAYYLMEWKDAVATLRSVARREGVPRRNPRCFDQRAGWIHYGTNLGAEACWSAGGKGNYRLVTMATSCKQLNVDGTRLRQPAIYLAMEGVDDRMEPVRAAGLAYTDAGYLLMNFEAGGYIPARNQPDSPGCKARLARNPGL